MKRIKKNWINYFVFLSLTFLMIFLLKNNYLVIPEVNSILYLVISFLLMFISLIIICWGKFEIFNSSKNKITFKDAICSTGIGILGKYIPGKIWIIVGQAGYLINKYSFKKSITTTLTFIEQFIAIWVGLLIGAISLLFVDELKIYSPIILGGWIILSIILFTKFPSVYLKNLFNRIFKGSIEIPSLRFADSLKVILIFALSWISLGAGFYLFVKALVVDLPINGIIGMGFILAVNLGLLMIFVPGGLGIREGVVLFYLKACGLPIEIAITITVASRLWALIGDFLLFLLAIILNNLKLIYNAKTK